MSRMLSVNSSSNSFKRCLLQTCLCLWATSKLSWAVKHICGVGALGRYGLPASITDIDTWLLTVCMANNRVVTYSMFQHRPVHLQIWYNRKATQSTKHQIDHVLLRRRDIKAVRVTRVFRGADIQLDHRLKLQLKFRKPAKHAFHPCLQPLLFTKKQAGKRQSPCAAKRRYHVGAWQASHLVRILPPHGKKLIEVHPRSLCCSRPCMKATTIAKDKQRFKARKQQTLENMLKCANRTIAKDKQRLKARKQQTLENMLKSANRTIGPYKAGWPHTFTSLLQMWSFPQLPQHHGTDSAQASTKTQRAWVSEATLHQAHCKRKQWETYLANPTSQSKAVYKLKAASQAAHKSALVDRNQHFTSMLTKVQQSRRKGETHSYQVIL